MTLDDLEARETRQAEARLARNKKLAEGKIDENKLLSIVSGKLDVQIERWQFGVYSSISPSEIAPTWKMLQQERPQPVEAQLLEDFDIYRTDRYVEGKGKQKTAFMRFYFVGKGQAAGHVIEVVARANPDGETFTVEHHQRYKMTEERLPSHLRWINETGEVEKDARGKLLEVLNRVRVEEPGA